MNDADADRVRTKLNSKWAPNLRCACCGLPPTCPQLRDEVWSVAWHAARLLPARPLVCSTPVRCRITAPNHRFECELTRMKLRELLCLECTEKALRRPLTLDDLEACVGNYPHFVMQRRALALPLCVAGPSPIPPYRDVMLIAKTPADTPELRDRIKKMQSSSVPVRIEDGGYDHLRVNRAVSKLGELLGCGSESSNLEDELEHLVDAVKEWRDQVLCDLLADNHEACQGAPQCRICARIAELRK